MELCECAYHQHKRLETTYINCLRNAELEGYRSVTPILSSKARKGGMALKRREISSEIIHQTGDICEDVEGFKRRGRLIIWIMRGSYCRPPLRKTEAIATVVAILHR